MSYGFLLWRIPKIDILNLNDKIDEQPGDMEVLYFLINANEAFLSFKQKLWIASMEALFKVETRRKQLGEMGLSWFV